MRFLRQIVFVTFVTRLRCQLLMQRHAVIECYNCISRIYLPPATFNSMNAAQCALAAKLEAKLPVLYATRRSAFAVAAAAAGDATFLLSVRQRVCALARLQRGRSWRRRRRRQRCHRFCRHVRRSSRR